MKIELIMHENENQFIEIEKNTCFYELLKNIYKEDYKKYLAVKINNKIKELKSGNIEENDKIEFLDIKNVDGYRIYVRTLSFIFVKACKDIFHDANITIEHSLNRGLYTELKKDGPVTSNDIDKIKKRMQEMIDEEKPINKMILTVKEAIKIFEKQGMQDKITLLNHWNTDKTRIYEMDGYYDTFYGYVAPNTNVIYDFDLKLFSSGIVINFPRKESNFKLPEYIEQKKLSKIFREAEEWGEIMDVGNVGVLNDKIVDKTIDDMIRINEAFHEKKIAYIADEITEDEDIKVVLIAGPSSSGKTTFSQRLSIQLRANGKKTFGISLDDYFVNREMTPKDENGEYDFETIDALDLELFNEHLLDLMEGKSVSIPVYNFILGEREYTREPIILTDDFIILVEGIHGLNDKLTSHILSKNKFKIYISALTQLNIDNHNRIATSDLRLIRRIVRDNTHRGNDVIKTLELWENVIKGSEKYIFPFQENSDAIFNSALVYELCVLKKYVIPLIENIEEDSIFYPEKQRLLKFLSYFKIIEDETAIPNTSILKEFIGGSCFEQ